MAGRASRDAGNSAARNSRKSQTPCARPAFSDAEPTAFAWLERGYRERDPPMSLLKAVPFFDPVHADPRFQDLLRRIGFPES